MSDDGDGAPANDIGPGSEEHPDAGDTFGVGIHVTSEELRFVVHVPSEIDSGWSDPDEFQRLIERVTWETLDQERTLRAVARTSAVDDTVTLGTVTMRSDGELLGHTLSPPTE